MVSMFARLIAASLVLVLVGPSVVAATCELTCAMGSHHHSAPASTQAPCHERQGTDQAVGVRANPSTLCHESGDLPSAVVDAWLHTVLAAVAPAPALVIAPTVFVTSPVLTHERRAPSDPPSTHRPLRV
jgi:hypothetical protein